MKRLVVTLLFGLAALPGPARAEEPIGCALTSAPLMAQPDGSILIGCAGGLTDPFGEQLVNVLNKILQSRLDPQAVLAKLEEVEAVPEQGVARTVSDNQRHAIMQALSGATNVVLQDRCPLDLVEHVTIQDDPVAARWVLNALGRNGPADPSFRPRCL